MFIMLNINEVNLAKMVKNRLCKIIDLSQKVSIKFYIILCFRRNNKLDFLFNGFKIH